MEALPSTKEFHNLEYWNQFYKQDEILSQKGFEWYGSYKTDKLDQYFEKLVTKKED